MEEHNNLEKFFKQQYSKNIPPESWNTPDDSVWTNINKELDKEPVRNRNILILPYLLTGLSLLLSMYLLRTHQQQKEKIIHLEQQIKKCNTSSDHKLDNTKSNITPENDQSKDDKASIPKDTYKQIKSLKKSTFKNKTSAANAGILQTDQINAQFKDIGLKFTKESIHAEAETITKSSEQLIDQEIIDSANDIEQSLIHTNEIKTNLIVNDSSNILPVTSNDLIIPERSNHEAFPVSTKPIQKNKQRRFSIGPSSRAIFWRDIISGHFDNPLSELLTKEKTKSSVDLGIHSSYSLNKNFTFNIGAYYDQRNQKSEFLLHLPYTTSTETLNNEGKYINNFKHSLPTGLGNVQTDILLSRGQGTSVADKEIIDLDFSFINQSISIQVPISVSYFPFKNNTGLFINMGIQNEFLIKNEIIQIHSLSHHTYVKEKQVNVGFKSTQTKSYNISTLTALGYKQKIWKDTHLILSGSYGIGLKSIYTTSTYKHKLDHTAISLSLLHSLGNGKK